MICVFGLSFIVELAYATYTIFVSRGWRWRAVISSAAIALLKTLLVYRVVFSIETLPALVAGQALGTLLVMSILPNKRGPAFPLQATRFPARGFHEG